MAEGLGLLCAARDALSLDELGRVAGWIHEPQRRAFLRGARELLIETRRTDAVREYRLHHDSIRAHVAETIGIDRLGASPRAGAATGHVARTGGWCNRSRFMTLPAHIECRC